MSTLRNKVQLIGNIGNDPKIMNLENGIKVARFSMATNEYYRNAQDEKVQSTQWHFVVAWDKKADIIEQYTHKGKEIAIEGKLISRSYTNEMGVKCYVTEIVASEVLLLGSKSESTTINEIPAQTEEGKEQDNILVETTTQENKDEPKGKKSHSGELEVIVKRKDNAQLKTV
ncbi:single-stranded DNA-binding protein [Flagellimonas onchidii]|uniref:single-stranded DNA-binding protein n=1 Tax=Flagellimonas onchidii TaxID=2562684 RepID=UPI0010A664B6|nr:single-stranded DNA-binding protein [Allomuricauda onchidii]